jgi:2-iminobutanoate/2-iminopropanoate deaminase
VAKAAAKESVKFGNFMEEAYGFAQAVKAGGVVYVSGQTAFKDDGTIEGVGDMARQMRQAYVSIAEVLARCGATMDDVVEETLFVTDMNAAVTVAHDVRKEFFGPEFAVASTLCQVQALGSPELLIEIKCTAHV